MKLIDYYKKEDFGVEHIFTLLKGKRRSFIQLGLSFNNYPDFPYLQISFGNNRLIDILFWVWKFGFALEIFSFTWKNWDSEDDETTT
jgi:hypothetical protein